MKARNLFSGLATSAVLALGSSHADTTDGVMDACIDAFVAAHVSPAQRVAKVKKDDASVGTYSRAHSRSYSVDLTASNVRSHKILTKATCTVDADGKIVLNDGTRESTSARLAAR